MYENADLAAGSPFASTFLSVGSVGSSRAGLQTQHLTVKKQKPAAADH